MSAESGPDVQDELAKTVAALCHLRGEFVLRSGHTASVYFDKYLFEAEPAVLGAVVRRLAALVPADTEVLAGLELGEAR
jgi:orotate phosphoribosyltransferase